MYVVRTKTGIDSATRAMATMATDAGENARATQDRLSNRTLGGPPPPFFLAEKIE